MKTLTDMQKEYEQTKEIENSIAKAYRKISDRIATLEEEINNYKIEHGLFFPMSTLEQYKGKTVRYIKLIVKNDDETFEIKNMYEDDYFKIDENGHLDYSSYNDGVMDYCKKINKYVFYYYGIREEYNFIGYMTIDVKED